MKSALKTLFAGLAITALAGTVQAVPINTAIGLSLDGSGSISGSDFALQRDAYANVLGNGSLLPADGSVVLYVNQFSTGVQTGSVARRISSEADRTTLISDINALTQLNGITNLGGGINDAASSLDTFLGTFGMADFASDFRALIDVSTDGFANTGPSAPGAALDAVNGVGLSNVVFDQVNCLGVGAAANCGFIPAGSFEEAANDFGDFQDALERKIGRELGTGGNGGGGNGGGPVDVPEPSGIALFALGLIGIAGLYRCRRG